MTNNAVPSYEVDSEWVHLKYSEASQFKAVYGFSGQQGVVHLEGVRFVPRGVKSDTLLIYMHPASTLQLLPMPSAMARNGAHVLCAGSRYARNDTALIMEHVVRDLGAYVQHAREVWGYRKVVLAGWSGGGSLSLYYQSQAEKPTVTHTPAGDAYDLTSAGLQPADAFILQAAHLSRAVVLQDWIDPSVLDENNPDIRDESLDLYHPDIRPPYNAEFMAKFRTAQQARVARRTAWVKEMLADLQSRNGKEIERCFVTHRTMAEPRFLDPHLDPNDRAIGTCYMGHPETVNSGPIGLARFSTLRAWLSQWSAQDTFAHGEKCAASITVPFLALEHSADDAVPAPHTKLAYDAVQSSDKQMKVIQGATHYFVGQPELLQSTALLTLDWLRQRGFSQ